MKDPQVYLINWQNGVTFTGPLSAYEAAKFQITTAGYLSYLIT